MAEARDAAAFRADVGPFYGPVSDSGVQSIRDVILCTTASDRGDVDAYRDFPPVGSPLLRRMEEVDLGPAELGHGVRIDRLGEDEADLVFAACTPRGHNFAPVKQFGQRYTFIRDVDEREWLSNRLWWDREGFLYDTFALARLVRDHADSLQYAARIVTYRSGDKVVSWHFDQTRAYSIRRDRDWLTYTEAEQLRHLLAAYWAAGESLPRRLTRAMWRFEYASSIRWADVVLPTLVSALEALLKTERHQATRQFKQRANALALELDVANVTEEWAAEVYDGRSEWVHGSGVSLFAKDRSLGAKEADPLDSEAFGVLSRVQDLVRAVIRRAIADSDFRARFDSAESVRRHWPVDGLP